MDELNASVDEMGGSVQSNSDDITSKVEGMSTDVENANEALNVIIEAIDPEDGNVDEDKITAAASDLGDSLKSLYDQSVSIQGKVNDSSKKTGEQLSGILDQMEVILGTVEHGDENLNVTISDVSGNDTDDDTLGKVSYCINYGYVEGDLNIGGIAGVLAEETDFDEYEDTEVIGEVSMNADYQLRVVLRDCINYGTVSATKQYAGGIAGQMVLGAVLECINLGNMDAMNADYVGGIVGASDAIIRDCSSKCVIAGDVYVGGIAGSGAEVKNCYAFVDIKTFAEKAGAVIGYTEDLPNGSDEEISGNFYFNAGKEAGGIDGIAYTGVAENVDVASFVQLPNLSELLQKVTIRFIAEGMEEVVYTLNVGDSLTTEQIPTPDVDANSEYAWELLPVVTSQVLGMGETATLEYLTEETITNILFDQTYQVEFDRKDTVISSVQRSEKNLSLALAEGSFSKNTTLEIFEIVLDNGPLQINGKPVVGEWNVVLSNTGINKLHFLINESLDAEKLVLYVKDASDNWIEREYVIEGSYIIFEFADGEKGFALQQKSGGTMMPMMMVAAGVLLVAILLGTVLRKKKAK